MRLSKLISAILLAATITCSITSSASAEAQLKIGTLSCKGEGGWGLILGSQKRMACELRSGSGNPMGRYEAVVTKYGLDIGKTGPTALEWAVLSSEDIDFGNGESGALAGDYAGVGADASVGVGVGANALIGGSNKSLVLQPLSVQASTGLNIAAGIQTLTLYFVDAAQ